MIKKIMKAIANGVETKNSILNSITILKVRVSQVETAHLRGIGNITNTIKSFTSLIKKNHTDMNALTKRVERLEAAMNKK